MSFDDLHFWLSVGKIIWIDVLLSGDNALVIAMACAALPPKQKFWGMTLGAAGAILLRIAITGMAIKLLDVPYLKIIGGTALLVIAIKLLIPEEEGDGIEPSGSLIKAIVLIVVADISMSIDNVIAVAVAANGSELLIVIGLLLSIPLIVTGATVISSLLDRYHFLVWAGAALLGWISGEVISSDPVVAQYLEKPFNAPWIYGLLGVVSVIVYGSIWRFYKDLKKQKEI